MCNKGCRSSWRKKKPLINGFSSCCVLLANAVYKAFHTRNFVLPSQSEGQHRCVGSSALNARLLLGHQPTWSNQPYRIFPCLQCSVFQSENHLLLGHVLLSAMMDVSILLPSIFLLPYPSTSIFCLLPHFPLSAWSLRDEESLAGNECSACVISTSVCRANRMRNRGVGIFLTALRLRSGEDEGISVILALLWRRDVVIGSPRRLTSVRAKCAQFAAAGSFHITTYTMYNRCASLSLCVSSGRMKTLWFVPYSVRAEGKWKSGLVIGWHAGWYIL